MNTLARILGVSITCLLVGQAGADLSQSHHDFSGAAWSGNEMCRPCHTPHNAVDYPNAPLWNHELTTATFQLYTSLTLDASIQQPNGTSKLCLSCHDGSVAFDSFGGNAGTRYIRGGGMGTDLRSDHPISFTYDVALASQDGGLRDPTTALSGLGGTIADDLLSSGQLQCTSCHDPHISRNDAGCVGCHNMHGGSTTTLSLRKSNTGSALCLTCHIK